MARASEGAQQAALPLVQPIGAGRTLSGVEAEAVSDEILWGRALAADGEAFGVLFDRHRDRLFRHVMRLAEKRQDAEDIVATAFLELWRRRRDVRLVDGSMLPWLLVTGTNVGLNVERGIRRYRSLIARLPRAEPAPDPGDVLADAGALGVDGRLQSALGDLGDADRQLLALVVVDGYSLTDAAEQLGLSVSAVKSRLHRARNRMRAQTGGHMVDKNLRQFGGSR